MQGPWGFVFRGLAPTIKRSDFVTEVKEGTLEQNESSTSSDKFPSSEIILDIVRAEYQNEIDRSSKLDQKIGVSLTITSTYFFILLQGFYVRDELEFILNGTLTLSMIYHAVLLILFIGAVAFSAKALVRFCCAISTHTYLRIDVDKVYTFENLRFVPDCLAASAAPLFSISIAKNKDVNDERVLEYKEGWQKVLISLAFFVVYRFLL